MIHLPEVTLIGMDSKHPAATLRAMRFCQRQMIFAECVFAGDLSNPWVARRISDWGFKGISLVTSDRADHEYTTIEKTHTLFDTTHCLYVEADSAVINPRAWKSNWLSYDFIGAPWPIGAGDGTFWVSESRKINPKQMAPIAGEHNNVGNGGFALKSRRFCKAIAAKVDRNNPHQICSDAWMCRTMRPYIEGLGMRYAPSNVAADFSCENQFYSGQFGMHGRNTIQMNGWDFSLKWL